ncbi:peptide ligase PGM1-related protein [Streptomyces sp. NPDC057617]|uniref:preATP grasp domain-containing protein n=1 Tax=Streptomyces sp. NPDC057617 TaxID=3346184 RepID=UPI00369B891C
MTRLLIGNDFNEDLFTRIAASWSVQRLAWFAEDGDVLVLPVRPEEDFLTYVTSLTGTRRSTLQVVVPPPGHAGTDLLTADRLCDPGFLTELCRALAGRPVADVLALWPDTAVVVLARALGAEDAVPGGAFVAQSGGPLVNSKTVFRAVAAGAGVPIAEGAVCATRERAASAIVELLDANAPVIVKQDYSLGGKGNEILSPVPGVEPVGARRTLSVSGVPGVHEYLDERWDELSRGGRDPVVVERYHPGSTSLFAEFLIADEGVEFGGHGEMIMAPLAKAQVVPARGLKPDTARELVDHGRRLCDTLHTMGYRGRLSADAVLTPDGELFFTEYNGRVTMSTHTYAVVGARLAGLDNADDRVVVERIWPDGWSARSFASAVSALAEAGLAYDPSTRTGVVFSSALDLRDNSIMQCVIAEDLTSAAAYESRLEKLFGPGGTASRTDRNGEENAPCG